MTPSTVSLGVYQASLADPDLATRETVGLMCDQIHAAAIDPVVTQTAETAVKMFGGGPLYRGADPRSDPRACALSCWWWVKHFIRALPHEAFKALIAAYPDKRQLLVSPGLLLRSQNPAGDCSAFTMLLCAMLQALGVGYELVTVAVDPAEPGAFSHVYPVAVLEISSPVPARADPIGRKREGARVLELVSLKSQRVAVLGGIDGDRSRIPLDAFSGAYPGWQVPAAHVFRYQAYDSAGAPVDVQRATPSRLNGYFRSGLGETVCVAYDEEGNCTAPVELPGTPAPASSQASPSGPSYADQLIGDLLRQWTKIGGQVVAPQTTVSQTRAGYSVQTPAGTSMAAIPSLTGVSGSTWLWLGVLGIGAVVAVKAFGGGRG